MRFAKVGLLICILFIFGCKKSPYSIIPNLNFIEFRGLTEDGMIEAGSGRILQIRVDFRDGDGNLGYPPSDTTNNITLIDNRDKSVVKFQFPEIPESYNPKGGIQGIYEIDYNSAFILKRTDSLHITTDTISWDIFITDQDGNQSNTITTSEVILF